eukprot:TRINITY_DN70292_c0_g1_i1.p1 TRINITY_DN70292_c0_g1~~TRINITY_DN70292_c0_g1_i1.p1  ORF type:complete len:454 (+),score=108.42 TRINITY_DN70292_c0_g1_i1:61-1422(+)
MMRRHAGDLSQISVRLCGGCLRAPQRSCSIAAWLPENPVAQGGLWVGAAGLAVAALRKAATAGLVAARRRAVVTAHVESRDDVYRWLMAWLARRPCAAEGPDFTVAATPAGPAERGASPVRCVPAPGSHLLHYRGAWLLLEREQAELRAGASAAPGQPRVPETLRLSCLRPHRDRLFALIAEAREQWLDEERGRLSVHHHDLYGNWERATPRRSRPLASVVLPGGLRESLLKDAEEFLGAEEWYAARGIPYRRGYLLHGPPGTGKSSFVAALCAHLSLPVYVLSLSAAELTDERLLELLVQMPQRSAVLCEDIDAAFAGREGTTRLSFSGLLNALDGVGAPEGRILFVTTNHPDRVDPALLRPGRVDVSAEFPLLGPQAAADMVTNFYAAAPEGPRAAAAEAVARCVRLLAEADPAGSAGVSPAALQGVMLAHKRDPAAGAAAFAARHCAAGC